MITVQIRRVSQVQSCSSTTADGSWLSVHPASPCGSVRCLHLSVQTDMHWRFTGIRWCWGVRTVGCSSWMLRELWHQRVTGNSQYSPSNAETDPNPCIKYTVDRTLGASFICTVTVVSNMILQLDANPLRNPGPLSVRDDAEASGHVSSLYCTKFEDEHEK